MSNIALHNAIFLAANTVKEAGRDQVLTQDVVAALQSIGRDASIPDHRRNRAIEMGGGMVLFPSGLAGHFFNRPDTPWPEADVAILEMGMLAREGYEDQLTVAYIWCGQSNRMAYLRQWRNPSTKVHNQIKHGVLM